MGINSRLDFNWVFCARFPDIRKLVSGVGFILGTCVKSFCFESGLDGDRRSKN